MLQQILVNTPRYVWAILVFLIFRGIVAARDRDLTISRLLIIPLVMLVLSLHDIVSKFGLDAIALGAWTVGMLAVALQRWKFGSADVGGGAEPGTVRIRGSWAPLVMMMAVFLTKYVASVMLAIHPGMAHNTVFAVTVCALFGVFNGYFLGQLARELAAARRILGAVKPTDGAAPA